MSLRRRFTSRGVEIIRPSRVRSRFNKSYLNQRRLFYLDLLAPSYFPKVRLAFYPSTMYANAHSSVVIKVCNMEKS